MLSPFCFCLRNITPNSCVFIEVTKRGFMKKYFAVLFVFIFSISVFAQKDKSKIRKNTDESKAMVLAKSAYKAHGGEKLKSIKTLSIIGSVDVTVSSFKQPASFATVFSGEKYRLQIDTPQVKFKQIFDGTNTFTSPERGVSLPPINRLGFPLLQRFGEEGFEVSELQKKKKHGFRITSPEGYYTDFYISKKTNRIKGYYSSYIVNNSEANTSVEVDKFVDKDGIIIPSKYAQRFNFGQLVVYAEFKAKEILLNTEISDDVFAL